MKKLLILLAITMVACTETENLNDSEFSTNELNLTPEQNTSEKGSESGSEENPIVVPANAYVQNVYYKVTFCSNKKSGEFQRIDGLFWVPDSNYGFVSDPYEVTSEGCIVASSRSSRITEYKFGTYYKIFGEVVRLSRPDVSIGGGGNRQRWIKNVPGNKIQDITFSATGIEKIGNAVPNPFNDKIDCSGLKEVNNLGSDSMSGLVENQLVVVTINKVKYVYKYDQYGDIIGVGDFIYVGTCGSGTVDNVSPCNGIAAWVSGKAYKAGEKVVYNNYLFTKLANGWKRGPKCS